MESSQIDRTDRGAVRCTHMRRRSRGLLVVGIVLAAAIPSSYVLARSIAVRRHAPVFELTGRPLGGGRPAQATPAYLAGARLAVAGDGALVIDADSGALILAGKDGARVAQLPIGRDAGLLAYDPVARTAYVADRHADRLAVVAVGDGKLSVKRTIRTPAEPYGVALTPDRKTVLVSTIADRTLVAYDAASGGERWRAALGREPRGLAVSPDGERALVAYLVTGTIDQIALRGATRRAEHVALATTFSARRCRGCGNDGDSFARASFAVTFLGAHQAVVAFQREVPVQQRDGHERAGSYGGGFEPPVTQHLAFVGFGKDTPVQVTAQILDHQPRALAWDSARDALYVAGLGSDSLLQIKDASQVGAAAGATARLTQGKARCGPDGLAVTPTGDVLVWCAFSRTLQRVELPGRGAGAGAGAAVATTPKVHAGPELIASRLSAPQHTGMVVFHTAQHATSQAGAMACSTCHPDHRADGLSWRIDGHELQTPVLAGRVAGTHPYKWDGGDKDLTTSLTMTMRRLGGHGLDAEHTAALGAYLEQLPRVRTPTRDAAAVARGKQLFDSAELGCRTCHDGPAYTDQERHKLAGSLAESDTPSLLGLAASAPYFHDGSAATLEAVLRERGAVHGMAPTTKLPDNQVADLVAFLETL